MLHMQSAGTLWLMHAPIQTKSCVVLSCGHAPPSGRYIGQQVTASLDEHIVGWWRCRCRLGTERHPLLCCAST